jgi:hypothetical protein
MPPIPQSLPELLAQIRGTRSPFERIKLLTRAWKLLSSMTPEQRISVAAQMGLDNADEVVEAIAAHSGEEPPGEILDMVEKAQRQGPAQLPRLIRDLRDPKRRAGALREGLRAMGEALAGTDASEQAGGESEEAAAPWLPPLAEPASGGAPEKETERVVVRPPAPWPLRQAPAPSQPPTTLAAADAGKVFDLPEPVPAPPRAALPEPVRETRVSPKAAPPALPQAPPPSGGLAERLGSAPTATARFRALRDGLDQAGRLAAGGLRPVLESFPDGWQRRRALRQLLEAGEPESFGDALALIESLKGESDRAWCLGTLAGRRPLSEPERSALLAAAPAGAARRRLERRLSAL